MIQKFQNIGKIGISLVLSYLVAMVVGKNLFLGNSPQINMQYIASLRETPSRVKVYLSSLPSMFQSNDVQKKMDEFKQKTGAVEVAVSNEEKQKQVAAVAQTTNPAPNALLNYVSKGVAASAPDKQGEVVLRLDPETQKNIEYKQFTRPDGTVLNILILK